MAVVNSQHGVMGNSCKASSTPPSYSAEHDLLARFGGGQTELPVQSLPFMDVTETILALGKKISFYCAANLPATTG